MVKPLVIWICLSLISAFSIGQNADFKGELSMDSVLVGQPSDLTLTLEISESIDSKSILWLIPSDSLSSGLEIHRTQNTESKNGNRITYKKEIQFSAGEPGYFPIEPMKVQIGDELYETDPLLITVRSTLKDPITAELRDSKESSKINYSWFDWFLDNWHWVLLILIALLILIGSAIYFIIKNRRLKPEQKIDLPPPPSPFEIVMSKIEKLEKSQLWQKGQLKEYHSAISYILREYLEGELRINALESTTGEIMTSLKKFELSNELLKKTKVSLSLTDLVKFAKQKPLEQENRQVLSDAKEVVMLIHKQHASDEK